METANKKVSLCIIPIIMLCLCFGLYYHSIMQKNKVDAIINIVNEYKPQIYTSAMTKEVDCAIYNAVLFNSFEDDTDTDAMIKKAISKLEAAEYKVLHPAPVIDPTGILTSKSLGIGAYAGTIRCSKWGLTLPVYYSGVYDSDTIAICQSHIDARNSGDLFGHPFGVPSNGGPGSFVGDHNTQTGYTFGRAKVGDILYITTPYGEFAYKVVRANSGSINPYYMYWTRDDVTGQGFTDSGHDLILYTCYPFNAITTDRRWIVYADLIGKVTRPSL